MSRRSDIPSLQLKAKHIRLKNLPESCSEFDVVFTGTSLDDSYEKELWRQAKKNNVPSIAFIDHWSVYSERFKDKNSFFVLPEIYLSKRLVGEAVGHNEAGVPSCATKVDQTPRCE